MTWFGVSTPLPPIFDGLCDSSHNMFDSSNSIEPDKFSNICIDYCYNIPKSYTDAMNCVDADSWKSAMSEEIDSLKINNTFDLVVVPRNAKIIKSRRVFTVKDDMMKCTWGANKSPTDKSPRRQKPTFFDTLFLGTLKKLSLSFTNLSMLGDCPWGFLWLDYF